MNLQEVFIEALNLAPREQDEFELDNLVDSVEVRKFIEKLNLKGSEDRRFFYLLQDGKTLKILCRELLPPV